jgi:hypothetical protein
MAELERRIFRMLKEGDPNADVTAKVLDLSDRDAARVLNRMEALENSDVFLLKPLLEEAAASRLQLRQLEGVVGQGGALTRHRTRSVRRIAIGDGKLLDADRAEDRTTATGRGRCPGSRQAHQPLSK